MGVCVSAPQHNLVEPELSTSPKTTRIVNVTVAADQTGASASGSPTSKNHNGTNASDDDKVASPLAPAEEGSSQGTPNTENPKTGASKFDSKSAPATKVVKKVDTPTTAAAAENGQTDSSAGGEDDAEEEEKEKKKGFFASVKEKASKALGITDAEDGLYEGFLVETKITFNLSVPTSAVEGAICVVNVILTLLKAFINKSKFLKAIQSRMIGIEACVVSLKKREPGTLEASIPALNILIAILVDYKAFVKYITKKPAGFFERVVTFFRSKSDLENLADFDVLFTRALGDLNVPLQADQLSMMEAQRTQLTALSQDIARIMAKLDETKVLTIAKRVLTDEEALSFWMDCLPDKFQVPMKEFVAVMFMWMRETKGMPVTRKSVEGLTRLVDMGDEVAEEGGEEVDEDDEEATAPDGFIDARETNILFQSMPADYTTMSLAEVTICVKEAVQKRREADKKIIRDSRRALRQRLGLSLSPSDTESPLLIMGRQQEKTKAEESYVSSLTAAGTFHCRFLCEATTVGSLRGMEKRTDVQTLYVTGAGALRVFGRDPTTHAEVAWRGQIEGDMTLSLEINDDITNVGTVEADDNHFRNTTGFTYGSHYDETWGNDNCEGYEHKARELAVATGEYRGNLFVVHRVMLSGLRATFLRLAGTTRWEGYWEQDGHKGDMFFFMEEGCAKSSDSGESSSWPIACISDDAVGVAIWTGVFRNKGKEIALVKKYLNRHYVTYLGQVTVSGNGLRSIRGEWNIAASDEFIETSGGFSMWEMMPNTSPRAAVAQS